MLKSLLSIQKFKEGDRNILHEEPWLKFLFITKEKNVSLERIKSISNLNHNVVVDYIERTLIALNNYPIKEDLMIIVEETLKWSDVAKCGSISQRKKWIEGKINLFVHNIGSAQIYVENNKDDGNSSHTIIKALIETHGLIGQFIRGELNLKENKPLTDLINNNHINKEDLKSILLALNYCIISEVSHKLWDSVKEEVEYIINLICSGKINKEYTLEERIKKLRSLSIKKGENFEYEYDKNFNDSNIKNIFREVFNNTYLWYIEPALQYFSLEEMIKMFLLVFTNIDIKSIRHISFERFMREIYYDYDGKKNVNLYKKRIIESYLKDLTFDNILNGNIKINPHVNHKVICLEDTVSFVFEYSPAGTKLIEFCVEADKAGLLYEQAKIHLFDFFGLRRDQFDRFHNEDSYLATMNQTVDDKKKMLDYVVGTTIADIGPGGGIILDLLEETFPNKKPIGIDISENVIESLLKKKNLEGRKWEAIKGDAITLEKYVEKGSIDTFIFSSIIHEIFSYSDSLNGNKFNYDSIKNALKSTFNILSKGGRIIIRDGIMSEPSEQKRIIKFTNINDMDFIKSYALDFKGRKIQYEIISDNEVLLPINDAMEFLYTYTWGEKSYAHEINEQFGYFTPSEYTKFIFDNLGSEAKIILNESYLQEGYTIALLPKVQFFNENRVPTPLPNSTCLIVIEKC